MNKVLIIGDIHLNEWSDFARQVYVGLWDIYLNSRLLEQFRVLEQVLDIIDKEKVDSVVILGDVFHRLTHQTLFVWKKVEKMLVNKRLNIVILVGNHDIIDESKRLTYFDYILNGEGNIRVVKNMMIEKDIGFLSFYRDSKVLRGLIDEFVNKGVRILFMHNVLDEYEYRGLRFKGGFSIDDFKKFSVVFNGHYHDYDVLRVGKVKIVNVGSIQDFSFADSSEVQKGVLVYDVKENHLVRYKLNYKKFKKVSSIEEARKFKDEYYVRLDVSVDKLKNLTKNDEEEIKVKVLPQRRERKVLKLEEALEEVIKQYKNVDLAREFISSLFSEIKNE